MSVAALVLAAALVVAGDRPAVPRLRRMLTASTPASATPTTVRPAWPAVAGIAIGSMAWATTGSVAAGVLSGAAGVGGILLLDRWPERSGHEVDEPADLAAAWAQLAVCLEAGLPVASAVAAAAEPLRGRTGAALRRVAGLLELGADPAEAWRTVHEHPPAAAFARAAGRSAGTGAALARAARTESGRIRDTLVDAAEARAQRAGVLITAPLGLCFLPAFVVVGIAPVVIGLAATVLTPW